MRMILAATLAIVPLLAKGSQSVKRLDEAALVFSEVMAAPDKGIPQDMLANAHCIIIVTTSVRAPKMAAKLIALLNKYSVRERTSMSAGSSQ